MENNSRCEVCSVDVHRASMQRLLKSKKRLGNGNQNEMIIPEWFSKEKYEPIKKRNEKLYNPKTLKQKGKENIKFDHKELDEELA